MQGAKPKCCFRGSLNSCFKVYYKSEKRHPDTANITKSIFDGVEKSGLIVNDAQITKIITEEYYDKVNPRFELEFLQRANLLFPILLLKRYPSDKNIHFLKRILEIKQILSKKVPRRSQNLKILLNQVEVVKIIPASSVKRICQGRFTYCW